jgi:hypothetical protein
VIPPAVPAIGIGAPAASDAIKESRLIGISPLGVPAATEKEATATGPSPMIVAFSPKATQVVDPLALEQVTFLPAASEAEPTLTVTPAMDAGYDMVH